MQRLHIIAFQLKQRDKILFDLFLYGQIKLQEPALAFQCFVTTIFFPSGISVVYAINENHILNLGVSILSFCWLVDHTYHL